MKMTIVIEVSEDTDPTLVDPHEVAELLIDTYDEDNPLFFQPKITFVSAEWNE